MRKVFRTQKQAVVLETDKDSERALLGEDLINSSRDELDEEEDLDVEDILAMARDEEETMCRTAGRNPGPTTTEGGSRGQEGSSGEAQTGPLSKG